MTLGNVCDCQTTFESNNIGEFRKACQHQLVRDKTEVFRCMELACCTNCLTGDWNLSPDHRCLVYFSKKKKEKRGVPYLVA